MTQGMPSRAIDRESVASFTDYLAAESGRHAVRPQVRRRARADRRNGPAHGRSVYGRLNWSRAALGGVAPGMDRLLFVALLLWIVVERSDCWRHCLGSGQCAIFGLIFGLVTYAFTGGRRDFVSRSAILPQHYDVMVESAYASEARAVLGTAT